MQRWDYVCHAEWKECYIYLEDAPLWIRALVEVADLRLPRWRVPLLNHFHVVAETGDRFTVAEWYGETLEDHWQEWVAKPLQSYINRRWPLISVPIPWELGKELFYKYDKEKWDAMEAEPGFAKFTRPEELNDEDWFRYEYVMMGRERRKRKSAH